MNDTAAIKHMVDRFLSWKLPTDFNPDAGIIFKAEYNESTPWPAKHEPVGTNLFTATQADAMVRHMLEGLPSPAPQGPGICMTPELSREQVQSISDLNSREHSFQTSSGDIVELCRGYIAYLDVLPRLEEMGTEIALLQSREDIGARLSKADLRKNWAAFCDCDYFDGSETFADEMESAGLIELVPCDDDALEESFAEERGIVKGGNMWRLTEAGRAALPTPPGTKAQGE